ncbi:MAG: glycoside hydrolase family 32 protein [Lactococcus chungangensis]|nr:glycoside hydrolase family 32 protein [Lactococcus chungangensis]
MEISTEQKKLTQANAYIAKNSVAVVKSPSRLHYHFMPPIGWMNDPNGLVYFNHEYHLFYQYDPYGVEWGPMHWGHAKSKDAVHWEYLPVALVPSEDYEFSEIERGHGCFSGSAVVRDKQLILMYTGNVDGRHPKQTQNIAISSDGLHFEKCHENPVIASFPEEGTEDFRDPKVWEENGQYYAVIGTKKEGLGKAALYRSQNLVNWNYLGICAQSNGEQGDMWECPDLFKVDDQDILLVSPMYGLKNSSPLAISGTFDSETGKFVQDAYDFIDYGHDFYAPQTLIDDQNRRIMIGWMNIWFAEMPEKKDGWVGAMTVSRKLSYQNNQLYQYPVKEIEELRYDGVSTSEIMISNQNDFSTQLHEAADIEIEIDLEKSKAEVFSIYLKASETVDEYIELLVDLTKGKLTCIREKSGAGEKTGSTAPFNHELAKLKLRILVDTNSIELFINDGQQVMTNRVYPLGEDNLFKIISEQALYLSQLNYWKMKTIWKGK